MEEKPGFDLNTTVQWATGVLKDPNDTALAYRETQAPWQRTFMHITLPLYVASAVVGYILSLLFGGAFIYAAGAATPFYFLISLAWSVASIFVVAFVFDFFAGVFEGRRSFDAAFAALSLAIVPSVLAAAVSPIPFLGWLISLVAFIYALVLLYRFVPIFLRVPDGKRVAHFIVSLLVAFVINLIVSGMLAFMFGPSISDYMDDAQTGDYDSDGGSGLFSDFERQADFAEQASQDRYDPPEDGRLSEAQVATYVRTLERTAELRERLGARFENADEQSPSITDVFSGVKDAVRLGTAEMEVVKTGGGNWAEHQWVKNQLEVARIQRDSSPAVEHNYELFQEYQDQIEQYE